MTYELAGTPAASKQLVTLHNSGHNLGVDSEWELVASTTLQFILQASKAAAVQPGGDQNAAGEQEPAFGKPRHPIG